MRRNSTRSGLSLSTSLSPCQYQSNNAPHSYPSACCSYWKEKMGEAWKPTYKIDAILESGESQDVLLTVHLNIILVINHINAQILVLQ